jgi:hypothetical protein
MMRLFIRVTLRLVFFTPTLLSALSVYAHRSQALSQTSGRLIWLFVLLALGVILASYTSDTIVSLIGDVAARMANRAVKKPTIQKPPGTHLHTFARAVFSKKTFQLVFEPTLHNMFDEYCEAIAAGHFQKARWIRIRGYWSFWSAVLAQLPISITKLVVMAWKGVR